MKSLIITIMLALTVSASIAQSKAPIQLKTDTPKYQYFVKIPVSDYNNLLAIESNYRNLVTYNPAATGEEKVKEQANLDAYVYGVKNRAKLDSVKVVPAKTK